jgi:hypothetical protein
MNFCFSEAQAAYVQKNNSLFNSFMKNDVL